jgi:hypothetical protein
MLAFRAFPAGGWRWDSRAAAVVTFGILALCGIADAIRLTRGSQKTTPRRLVFGQVNDQGGNAAGYLATYLLPFIGLVPQDWGDWASYALYFIVALIVFIRSDLTFMNPTLYLLNRRVVSANAYIPGGKIPISGSPFVIVCRDPKTLASSVPVDVTSIAGGFVTKDEPEISGSRLSAAREYGGDLSGNGHQE